MRDGGNARYTVFDVRDTAAVAVESIRMAHNDANFQAPILLAVYDTFALGVRRDSLDVGSVVRLVTEG